MRRFRRVGLDFACWTCAGRLVIVVGMAKADVLDRVAADLACGYTAPAIQRLASLVHAHPTDLDLRRRLAAVHRMVGNRVEAGRGGDPPAGAGPAGTEALERADPSPGRRPRVPDWPAPPRAPPRIAPG